MQIKDTPHSYGWISICLHWITAGVIFALWMIGSTLSGVDAELRIQLQKVHVSLGGAALLILLFRIVWRAVLRHPYLRGQSHFFHRAGLVAHYAILVVRTGNDYIRAIDDMVTGAGDRGIRLVSPYPGPDWP